MPREPVDPARIGRRVVRRRATGRDVGAVAAALEQARFDARQNSRHEDLTDDVRGPAELAEWERIDQLLADAVPGTVYDPDADDVVQAELAADAAAAAREAELREAAWIAARADELQEHDVVVAVRAEHSDIGHHHEELLADGKVIAWTEPPFGETVHPGEDDPDYNPVCHCPGSTPRAFCMRCASCDQCRCPARPS